MKKSELENWKKLYELMIEIKKLAPWEQFDSDDLIELRLKDSDSAVLISVMGNLGECYGIAVYPTPIGQISLLDKLDGADFSGIFMIDPLSYAPAREEALIGYFGDRKEIDKETYALIKELGLKFRGKNNWIFFKSFHRGQLPRLLNAEEVELLISCYEALLESLQHLDCLDFDESPVIAYVEEASGYRFGQGEINVQVSLSNPYFFKDELAIQRLKKAKKLSNDMEMTYFYLPVLGEEDGHLAVMFLVVDRFSEMILEAKPLDSDGEVGPEARDFLIQFITEYGRPNEIHIRVNDLGQEIGHFCELLDIPIYATPQFTAIDEIAMDIVERMF